MKECPSCAMDIDSKETVCPICGYEFAQQPVTRWVAILLVAMIILFLLYEFLRP